MGGLISMLKDARPHFLRRTFFTGLLILLPLVVTYTLVAFLFTLFAGAGAPLVKGLFRLLGFSRHPWIDPLVPFVNLLLALSVIFVLGLVGKNILGRRILTFFERLLMRLPVVRTVYGAAKQMVETFQGPGRSFQRVVLLQYPNKGLWMMGFVAAERRDTMQIFSVETVLTVFIPTTPNPTSGFLVLVSPEDVVDVDYSVEEAFKFIVSSGIVGKNLTTQQSQVIAPALVVNASSPEL
jgi:uncharacterized membrane protein